MRLLKHQREELKGNKTSKYTVLDAFKRKQKKTK